MRRKELCTRWSAERTLRIDAMGRRYRETEQVYIPATNQSSPERYADNAEALWRAIGLVETRPGVWEGVGVTVRRNLNAAGGWADLLR